MQCSRCRRGGRRVSALECGHDPAARADRLPPLKPRILVVEDEPGIADTIRYALASDGFEPVCVGTGAEALRAFDEGAAPAPALVVLDVGLPDVNGFELIKQLHARVAVPVIFLTARSDEIDRVVGLELGADDYVAKPFSPRELVARVRTVLRRVARSAAPAGGSSGAAHGVEGADGAPGSRGAGGGRVAQAPSDGTATAADVAPLRVDVERRRIHYYGRALDLPRYEFGLLRTLASRPGRVWSRDELLAQVWGADTDSFDRTVDAHVKTVRAKLKAIAPDVEAIVTHRGAGYALEDPLPPAANVRLAPPA
jgi:two-component system catabolic regulation response regulator CreB